MLLDIVVAVASCALVVKGQCSGTTTILNSAQATALAECSTFDGDVVIDPNSTSSISIRGLSFITGDLKDGSRQYLTSLSADDLVTVGQEFSITSNVNLTSVSLPSLRNIRRLWLTDLPNLTVWKSALNNVSNIKISGTGFTDLSWLTAEKVNLLTIEDNPFLNNITLQINASGYTSFARNGPALRVSLPNLQQAYNLTVRHCQDFQAPSLTRVTLSAGFLQNSFQDLSIPKLGTLGSTLMLWNNTALSTLDLPVLTNVSGDVRFGINPTLQNLTLPQLTVVEGDILINDSMKNISMPNLVDVQGDVFVRSSSTLDCSVLDPYDTTEVFKRQYYCSSVARPSNVFPPPEDTSTGGGGLSGGAKGGIAAGVVGGVLVMLVVAYLLWRRKRSSTRAAQASFEKDSQSGHHGVLEPLNPAELDAPHHGARGAVAELYTGEGRRHVPELDSANSNMPVTELYGTSKHRGTTAAEVPEESGNRGRYELDA